MMRGFTLIELILVLSVGSMITLLSFQGMKRANESTQASMVGQQMRIIGQAVNNYISTRYTPISQLTNAAGTASDPGPRTCTAGTASCTITVQTLVNEGLLPANYANTNSFFSPYTILLKVAGTSPNWQVNGLVTTTNPWTVGGLTRYDLLGQAMVAAGPDSGMTRNLATELDGYNGIWSEVQGSYSNITQLGQLGFRAGYGSALYSAYLRRDGSLPMTGDLNMNDGTAAHNIAGSNNITGAGRLTMNPVYSSYVNLAGNLDMTGTATISGNANVTGNVSANGVYGNLLTSYGNANIAGTMTAGHATLPGGGSLTIGSSTYYGDGSNSAIYQNGSLYLQHPGGAAADIAIVGNINSQGSLLLPNGGQVNSSGTSYYETAGNLYLKPWNGNGQTIVGGGGGSGQLVTTGRFYSNEYIQVNGGATAGGGCSPNGLIGNSGSGPVFCTNGLWKSASGTSFTAIGIDVTLGTGGVWTFSPTAYVGGVPQWVFGTVRAYGGSSCEGSIYAQWRDIYGNVTRGWTLIGGFNVGSGNDGGSGMTAVSAFSLPMYSSAYYVDFQGQGCHGGTVEIQGVGMQ